MVFFGPMKKRLRKKLHLKEFKELGFVLKLAFDTEDSDKLDGILDQIFDVVEDMDLDCGGVMDELVVSELKPNSGLAARKDEFLKRISNIQGITQATAGELIDVWHTPLGDDECDCGCGCHHEH